MARLRISVVIVLSGLGAVLVLPRAVGDLSFGLHATLIAIALSVLGLVAERPIPLLRCGVVVAFAYLAPMAVGIGTNGTVGSRIVESLLLGGLVAAATLASESFAEVSDRLRALEGAATDGPIPWDEAEAVVRTEMKRARRTGLPLSVLVLRNGSRSENSVDLARAVHAALRDTDTVILRRHGREAVVLSPATTKEQAQRLIARLRSEVAVDGVSVSRAAFPDDGYTFESVLEAATEGVTTS